MVLAAPLSVHMSTRPILENTISQEHIDRISSDFVPTAKPEMAILVLGWQMVGHAEVIALVFQYRVIKEKKKLVHNKFIMLD